MIARQIHSLKSLQRKEFNEFKELRFTKKVLSYARKRALQIQFIPEKERNHQKAPVLDTLS